MPPVEMFSVNMLRFPFASVLTVTVLPPSDAAIPLTPTPVFVLKVAAADETGYCWVVFGPCIETGMPAGVAGALLLLPPPPPHAASSKRASDESASLNMLASLNSRFFIGGMVAREQRVFQVKVVVRTTCGSTPLSC